MSGHAREVGRKSVRNVDLPEEQDDEPDALMCVEVHGDDYAVITNMTEEQLHQTIEAITAVIKQGQPVH